MEEAKNIIFLGFSGVGKIHLATSIGIERSRNKQSTYFIKFHDLNSKSNKHKG